MSRSVLTPVDLGRIVLGWGAVVALLLRQPLPASRLPAAALTLLLAAIIAVIAAAAFGVVTQAEALAHRMGDPYGSLVLTLSIVLIEVILISAVMLGPGEHATIARDSVTAVSMIIMNLVIGLALLLGGLRHGRMRHNRAGARAYLSMLAVLGILAFGLPPVIGRHGAYTTGQAVPVIVLTLGLYAFFLIRQLGSRAGDFREVDIRRASRAGSPPIREVLRVHRREILIRLAVLIVTVVPIVLLSHDMATFLDDGLGRMGAPVALAGVLIAMIVFLPESLTAIRAALAGEVQRVSNLCHGALVSTVGLTIPAVLSVGILIDQPVVLAESPANLILLGLTLLLSAVTFLGRGVTAIHGAAHLALFAAYAALLFL